MRKDNSRRLRASSTIAANADQVEAAAIRDGAATPSDEGIRDDEIAGIIDADTDNTPSDFPSMDESEPECMAGETLEEIERRVAILGDRYPFEVRRGSVTYRQSESGVYEMLLLLSVVDNPADPSLTHTLREFERISGEAVARFIGHDAEWFRTGYPFDEPYSDFESVIRALARKQSDWEWRASAAITDQRVNDAGLDVVVWRPAPGGRPGSLHFVGQCGCGKNWDDKLNEPNLAKLSNFMMAPKITPIRFFATPRHVASDKDIIKHLINGQCLVMDRTRLVLALGYPHGQYSACNTSSHVNALRTFMGW